MEKISVVLVDGNEDFRGLLQEYMERDGAFTVLASVGDGMEALRAVRRSGFCHLIFRQSSSRLSEHAR